MSGYSGEVSATATDVGLFSTFIYSTAWSIWAEKKGIKTDDLSKNPHVQRSIAREPVARAIANRTLERLCTRLYLPPQLSASTGQLDGYDAVSKTVLEIKVPSEGKFIDFDAQLERDMPQPQTQLLVSRSKTCFRPSSL